MQTGIATWSINGGEGRGRKRSATEEVRDLSSDTFVTPVLAISYICRGLRTWWLCMQSSTGAENARRLALLGIGEIGRCADLSAFPQLQQSLTAALTSPSEDIKAAASLALGAVSIGNMDTYLPFIIQQINEQVGQQLACFMLPCLHAACVDGWGPRQLC